MRCIYSSSSSSDGDGMASTRQHRALVCMWQEWHWMPQTSTGCDGIPINNQKDAITFFFVCISQNGKLKRTRGAEESVVVEDDVFRLTLNNGRRRRHHITNDNNACNDDIELEFIECFFIRSRFFFFAPAIYFAVKDVQISIFNATNATRCHLSLTCQWHIVSNQCGIVMDI